MIATGKNQVEFPVRLYILFFANKLRIFANKKDFSPINLIDRQ